MVYLTTYDYAEVGWSISLEPDGREDACENCAQSGALPITITTGTAVRRPVVAVKVAGTRFITKTLLSMEIVPLQMEDITLLDCNTTGCT